MENELGTEKLTTIPRAFLFDVDGVISDPQEKKITTPGLGRAIGERINLGEAVSLNTGRSISWLVEHGVIGEIEAAVDDKNKLDDFIAVGEKGATWLTYDNGEWTTHVDQKINVPEALQNEVRDLINSEFSDSMFFDESKLTMISTEMHDKFPVATYTERQKVLVEKLKALLADKYADFNLKIDPTTIATDIQQPQVGKHLGARRIEEFLNQKGLKPEHVVALGDSQSDTEMAEELQDEYSVEFVFVGDTNKFDQSKLHCPVIVTKNKFGQGTLEYLQSIK